MKHLILIILILTVFFSVNCSNEINVMGSQSSHFNKKEIKMIRAHNPHSNQMRELVISSIIINDSIKVGLYKYMIYNTPSSVNAVYKLLKFEDKIIFPSRDSSKNEIYLRDFENSYKHNFNEQQLKLIRELFLKGTEVTGRLL